MLRDVAPGHDDSHPATFFFRFADCIDTVMAASIVLDIDQIQAIVTSNKAAISCISSLQSTYQREYAYQVVQHDFKTEARAFITGGGSVSSFVSSWRTNTVLNVVTDMFNDKVDYTCRTFADIARLNTQMHRV